MFTTSMLVFVSFSLLLSIIFVVVFSCISPTFFFLEKLKFSLDVIGNKIRQAIYREILVSRLLL